MTLLMLSVLLPGLLAVAWVTANTWRWERHAPPADWAASATLQVAIWALCLLGVALAGLWWVATRPVVEPSESPLQKPAREPLPDRVDEASTTDRNRIEALGRLTGGVVHDFNNLLGVISNSAHLIERQVQAAELQAPVAATLRAVEAGSRLTQHLMRFSDRQPSPPHAVDLSSMLSESDEFLRAIAGRRITLSVAVAATTRHAMVDANGLELALTTLTLDARDAMPSGGRLRLHACNAATEDTYDLAAGDYVLITVGDDGTADGESTGPTPSLQQVHAFCVRSGGTSRRASTPGLGTTVSILLPAC
mgnify:CR=1 FL=1|jgi:signal transduction histidine kinase